MKNKINNCWILLVWIFNCILSANGQVKDSTLWQNHPYAKVKRPVKAQSDSGQFWQAQFYNDRRAKQYTIGLLGGGSLFYGDADKKQLGWTFAPYLRYSISQTFSLRAEYSFGLLRGQRDLQNPSLYKDNFKFKSQVQDWSLQMMFTLGNISFIRPLRKTQLYLFAGIGQSSFRSTATFTDQRMFLGDYYLTSYLGHGIPNPNLGKQVTEKFEGRYLSSPTGLGLKFYLSPKFDIGFEYRHTWLRSDDLDIYNTQIWQNRWWDSYAFTRFSLGYKFGAKNPQHYDWLSPVNTIYDDIVKLSEKVNCLEKDKDNDHVPDCFDIDNSTPDSCMVYGNGLAVDTDSDGVPDCADKEVFSLKGAEVDTYGKAIDSDLDGVPDIKDRESNTRIGAIVDNNGIEIVNCPQQDTLVNEEKISTNKEHLLDFDKINLRELGHQLRVSPEKKILIVSPYGKSSKYNSIRSTRLISEIIEILMKDFGISKDRIIVDYTGFGNTSNDILLKIER